MDFDRLTPVATSCSQLSAEIADEHGVYQKAPKTDDEWNEVRNQSLSFFEGMNLAAMNRKLPGMARSQFPEVENEPDQIQNLIDEDRPGFFRRAKGFRTRLQCLWRLISGIREGAI